MFARSGARNTDFSYAEWALDQIVRLDLKKFAPELRKWYDERKARWASTHDPYRPQFKMPWILWKLGAPITPEEEALLRKGGRRP